MKVRDEVVKIMAEILEVDESKLEDDIAIGDLDKWDSLHHLSIISAIEKKFDIRFTPDVLMDLEDVSDIVKAVEDRLDA